MGLGAMSDGWYTNGWKLGQRAERKLVVATGGLPQTPIFPVPI
jgi:hypothetical protein